MSIKKQKFLIIGYNLEPRNKKNGAIPSAEGQKTIYFEITFFSWLNGGILLTRRYFVNIKNSHLTNFFILGQRFGRSDKSTVTPSDKARLR